MAHDIKPNEHYCIISLQVALATVCGNTAADGLNEILREHIGAGLLADYAFCGTDRPVIVTASSDPVEGELFVEPATSETEQRGDSEISMERSKASGGKRFYSNSRKFLEGVAEGIEFTADSALKVGHVMDIEPVDGCSYLLEVEEWDNDSWYESFHMYS